MSVEPIGWAVISSSISFCLNYYRYRYFSVRLSLILIKRDMMHQLHHAIGASRHQRSWEAKEDVVHMCQKWYDYMQPGWCQPVRQEFMENECEALPGVAHPGVRDNRSTLNTKTRYDDDDDVKSPIHGQDVTFGYLICWLVFVLHTLCSQPVNKKCLS